MMKKDKKPVVVVLGAAGTGKSALCNTLCGDISKAKFPESSGINYISKTGQETVKWFGIDSEFILVDTPGLGGSDNKDNLHIDDMVKTIKQLNYVNTFIIVLNGQNPRMDRQLKTMLTLFQVMFGEKFLENVLFVFTKWPVDQRSRAIRTKLGENEEVKAKEYNQKIQQLFHFDTKTSPIKCFFIDNCYLQPDMDIMKADELEQFQTELNKLKTAVEAMSPFEIIHVERKEDKQKYELAAMKEIHESLKNKSREEYTVEFTRELQKRFPNRNCLLIDNKWTHTVNLNNYTYEHFEKPAKFGTHGYAVYVFDDGFVRKGGDGGNLNWSYQGCYTLLDTYTLVFQINE